MNTFKAWIEIVSLFFVVVGALNWGLVGAFKFNLVSWIARHTNKNVEPIIYVAIGVAALLHILSRDYYLRFLGQSAFPCGSLVARVPENADTTLTVLVEPNVNVMYWAAEPGIKVQENPWIAYKEFANAGVVRSDASGRAILKFRHPASYKVPMRGALPEHVHYRVCRNGGMMSRVETIRIPPKSM